MNDVRINNISENKIQFNFNVYPSGLGSIILTVDHNANIMTVRLHDL